MERIPLLVICIVITEVHFYTGLRKRETQQGPRPNTSYQTHTENSAFTYGFLTRHQLAGVFLPWCPLSSSELWVIWGGMTVAYLPLVVTLLIAAPD